MVDIGIRFGRLRPIREFVSVFVIIVVVFVVIFVVIVIVVIFVVSVFVIVIVIVVLCGREPHPVGIASVEVAAAEDTVTVVFAMPILAKAGRN